MKKEFKFFFIVFRDITMLATFVLASIYEHASKSRLILLVSLFAFFFVWIHAREQVNGRYGRLLPYSFVIDIFLLMAIDYLSRYVVNYYFNVYYFFTLIEIGLLLKQKQRLALSFCVIMGAFVKYYRLIGVYNMPYILSYTFFTLMVFVTIAVFFNYSRILTEEKSKLNQLNEELKEANELLEQKNMQIKELTIFEERNRIAREIHDSVGHNLTGLVMNLDFCSKLVEMDVGKAKQQAVACRDLAKESLDEIRRSVQALKPPAIEQFTLVKSLSELIEKAKQKFAVHITLKVEGEMYKTPPEFNIIIYRAVQESITNSVRHGKAKRMEVVLTFAQKQVSLFIKDDGQGSKKMKIGNGLKGMTERVKELDGEISFYCNDGFMTHIYIPVEGRRNEQN